MRKHGCTSILIKSCKIQNFYKVSPPWGQNFEKNSEIAYHLMRPCDTESCPICLPQEI